MLPAMTKRVFVVMLLGLGFAKLPAAELKIWMSGPAKCRAKKGMSLRKP